MTEESIPLEAPAADAAEQASEVAPAPSDGPPTEIPLDANPADVAEQARELPAAEEEYR